MNELPNIGLFGNGGNKYGEGGKGIEKILENFGLMDIKDTVKVIVSPNWNGGLKKIAYDNGIPFKAMSKLHKREADGEYSEPHKKEIQKRYIEIIEKYELEYVFLSGWLVQVLGLEPNKTVNIHPGPLLEQYSGKGMYGMNLHNKIWQDYVDGKINKTCITMHFVTEKYDNGPIIAQVPVGLVGCNSAKDVQKRVNEIEKVFQWKITLMVMTGEISWSGIEGDPVKFPENYTFGKEVDLMDGVSYKLEG